MGKNKGSIERKNRLAHVASVLTLIFVVAFIWCGVSFLHVSFYVSVCISLGLGNILSFLSNKMIYGRKHYHEELLWVGFMLLISTPILFVIPTNLYAFVTALVFLLSSSAVSLRIHSDAETLLRESITGNLGRLLSFKSRLSSPVRLGIMILLRTKNKMAFSDI